MPDGDDGLKTPKDFYRELVLSNRELIAEIKIMRNEISRFNLFISSISEKAGHLGVAKSLLDMFLKVKDAGKK